MQPGFSTISAIDRIAASIETTGRRPAENAGDGTFAIRIPEKARVRSSARHWYSTLCQMMRDMAPQDRSAIEVDALFGKVTTAGEWYLAIPSYSAAPEVGLELIRMLTTPDRELQRLYRGIGLPTHASFYDHRDTGGKPLSPETVGSDFLRIRLDLARELVTTAFRRSQFACYQRFSPTVSAHLQRIRDPQAARRGSYKRPSRNQVDSGTFAS